MTAGGSLWMEGTAPSAPPLAGDVDADVAIIGAGYTGLSTAATLRAAGHSVVVLEAEQVGFGASGRNAGHLTPVIGKDLPTLALLFRKRARALVELVELAVGHVERTIADHAIDCAYEPAGNVMAAVHEKQHGLLDKAAKAAAALGLDAEMLEERAMHARGFPATFTRGMLMRRGGILHPGRYVRGLARIAEAAGARLYERTPVLRIEEGLPAVLVTPGGRVRARAVVLGTNAYTGDLGWLRGTVARLHVYLFATRPLSEDERAAVGWRGREGIYTAHEMLESYRLTDDHRIVGGAKTVRYGFDGRALPDDPATFDFLDTAFRARFPMLRAVSVTHRWGGPIAFALDFLPAVGVTGAYRNVHYSVGYAGHGIAMGSYAGTMIADQLLGRDGPGRVLSTPWKVPMPPEPIRWLVAKGLVAAFGAVDRRTDRSVRERAVAASAAHLPSPRDVLDFWFADACDDPAKARARGTMWFGTNPALDAQIAARFGALYDAAAAGQLHDWTKAAESSAALVVVLDQFPRNMFRGTARAFAADELARAVAEHAVDKGYDRALSPILRCFLYLPFEHAEDLAAQERSVALHRQLVLETPPEWRDLVDEHARYAEDHRAVIERFGRFPHRNGGLGRTSTAEEEAYLAEGAARYGQ